MVIVSKDINIILVLRKGVGKIEKFLAILFHP